MKSGGKRRIRRALLLGRKEGAAKALSFLLKNGIEVPLVVAKKDEPFRQTLDAEARKRKIPVYEDAQEVYTLIEKKDPRVRNIDCVISYLFWQKIKSPLFTLGARGCVNFHPAPLPDYKGRAGYNTAILDGRKTFGVSAHFIDSEEFDAGPIIEVISFPFDANTATAFHLEREAQKHLLALFKKVLLRFMTETSLRTIPNFGGVYLSSAELESLKRITPETDSAETVEKKIRAFFFPPYHGATIAIDGKDFTLIDEKILHYLADLMRKTKQ